MLGETYKKKEATRSLRQDCLKALCSFIAETWASKGLPSNHYGVYAYAIKLHGAFGHGPAGVCCRNLRRKPLAFNVVPSRDRIGVGNLGLGGGVVLFNQVPRLHWLAAT